MATEAKPVLSMESDVEFVREGAVSGRYQDVVLRSVTPGKEPKESTVRAFLGMAATLASWKRAHVTIEREAVGAPWTITKTRAFAPPPVVDSVAPHATGGSGGPPAGQPQIAQEPATEEASDLENAVAELQDEIGEMTDKLRERLHELGYMVWNEDTFSDLLSRIPPMSPIPVVAKEGTEDGKLRPALEKAVKALEEAVDARKSRVSAWSKVVEEGRTALAKPPGGS